jgi:hypothetical protein
VNSFKALTPYHDSCILFKSWRGWHRHVALVMLTFAMMTAIRHKTNAAPPKKDAITSSAKAPLLIRWSIQEIHRIAIKLAHRRVQPAHIIAWSSWRHAHQAQLAVPISGAQISKEKRNCNARFGCSRL